VKTDGRSNLKRAAAEPASRSRSSVATATSLSVPVPGFILTWMRATFSPSVPVFDNERPAPPVIDEKDSTRSSSARTV